MVTCAADGCNVLFKPVRTNHRYCSPRCAGRQQNRDRVGLPLASTSCLGCGTTFQPRRSNQKYCTTRCCQRSGHGYPSYSEYHKAQNRKKYIQDPESFRESAARWGRTYRAKAKAYDRIVDVGTWWTQVKEALQQRTDIPEPPAASLEDIAV